jgi:hypothetical protein
VTHAVAELDDAGRLSLSGVFAELRRTEVALCADSFVAHAAPRYGCTTLVVASPGLENWRVPSGRSFYFDADRPIGDLIAAMRQILELHGLGSAGRPEVGEAERRMAQADADLLHAVTNGVGVDEVRGAYERFNAAHAEVIARVAEWPAAAAPLAADYAYDLPARSLNGGDATPRGLEDDTRRFVQNHLLVWRNTNLHKYVRARLEEARR